MRPMSVIILLVAVLVLVVDNTVVVSAFAVDVVSLTTNFAAAVSATAEVMEGKYTRMNDSINGSITAACCSHAFSFVTQMWST